MRRSEEHFVVCVLYGTTVIDEPSFVLILKTKEKMLLIKQNMSVFGILIICLLLLYFAD